MESIPAPPQIWRQMDKNLEAQEPRSEIQFDRRQKTYELLKMRQASCFYLVKDLNL